jgi:hypothetical protein
MVEERGTLGAIEWQEAFPAVRLFSAVRLALRFRALLLAAIGLVLVSGGWHACGRLFSGSDNPDLQEHIRLHGSWPWEAAEVSVRADDLASFEVWRERSPLVLAWQQIAAPFRQIYALDITFTHFVYLLTGALWTLAVWALVGGGITRLAAVSIAQQGAVSTRELARFVLPRWGSYFMAPLLPILGTFLLAGVLAALGLLLRGGAGLFVAGLLWWAALIIGFLMAFLVIALFFGFPLMWGAISAEGTDAFGALSLSYSYTCQRPLAYLAYAIIAAIGGVLGWFLISIFAFSIIQLATWGVSWGSGAQAIQELRAGNDLGSAAANWGGELIGFWNRFVGVLATAFVFSYFWSVSTVIYFLLRRLVDATEIDDVFMSHERERHGLPPLKTGADGVAEPADEPAAPAGDADPPGAPGRA